MVTENEPFGRQPMPVKVVVSGSHAGDVVAWAGYLASHAEYKGDMIQFGPGWHDAAQSTKEFTIYPRAVND